MNRPARGREEGEMWTHFWDTRSGGRCKERWNHIYIEAPEAVARVIFYNRFGHNPSRVTCTCCGEDYSVSEGADLAQLTGYHRGLRCAEDGRGWHYGKEIPADYRDSRYLEPGDPVPEGMKLSNFSEIGRVDDGVTLDEYRSGKQSQNGLHGRDEGVLFIPADEIKPEERVGEVPEQGFLWVE